MTVANSFPSSPSSDRIHRPSFRLPQILKQCLDREGGKFNRLVKKINEANGVDMKARNKGGHNGRDVIDRRKLARIIRYQEGRDDNLVLSIRELRCLDTYLDQFNEGLAHKPIFERQQILQKLAEVGELTFLIATKPQENHVEISHWDVDSMFLVQRGVQKISTACQFDMAKIFLSGEMEAARRAIAQKEMKRLLGESGPSIVCVGSSRACYGAEAMLAEMLGARAFEDSAGQDVDIPFRFVWTPEDGADFHSCVALSPDQLACLDPEIARDVVSGKAWAFEMGGVVYRAERPAGGCRRVLKTYGVVAVQRRASGQIWMVIAGLSGAGTFAAARAVYNIPNKIPDTPLGEHSPVQLTIVEANIRLDGQRATLGDGTQATVHIPKIVSVEVVDGTRLLSDAA